MQPHTLRPARKMINGIDERLVRFAAKNAELCVLAEHSHEKRVEMIKLLSRHFAPDHEADMMEGGGDVCLAEKHPKNGRLYWKFVPGRGNPDQRIIDCIED